MFRMLLSIVALSAIVLAQPSAARAAQEGATRSTAKATSAGVLNINTASAGDFETLPGVGPKTAALIIEYRQKNGPFKKIEDLMNVRGIGEKNFLKLKSQLTITTPKAERANTQGH